MFNINERIFYRITSCLMSAGKAARNDGSTPSMICPSGAISSEASTCSVDAEQFFDYCFYSSTN